MAKEAGLGWTTLSVDDATGSGRDIRDDVNNFTFAMPQATQDATGVDKYAIERLALLADFSGSLSFTFDDATNRVHDVLCDANTGVTRTVVIAHSGQSLTNECLFTDYALTRGQDGSLTGTSPFVLANGVLPAWTP
jgi:hypothetical protein